MKLKSNNLYDAVKKRDNLRKAWLKVRSNGLSSKSKETRLHIKEFDRESDRHLQNISQQLYRNRFKFDPSVGYAAPKGKKKGYRPIVSAKLGTDFPV